ncbi:MAG: SWIM zinc finger family protein [Thermoguttaceae bacterium]
MLYKTFCNVRHGSVRRGSRRRAFRANQRDVSKCTCPWYAKHQGERGPCKHVLAVQLMLEEKNEP